MDGGASSQPLVADHGPGETVMRGNEMENEILVVCAKRFEIVVGFYVGQRTQLVPVAVEEVKVDRPPLFSRRGYH